MGEEVGYALRNRLQS